MKIHIQRVSKASVEVGGSITGAIGQGLLLLVGFGCSDQTPPLEKAAEKISTLRIFPDSSGHLDSSGHFDRSLNEVGGGVLSVPQFTLYGDCGKGRRPDFSKALNPDTAKILWSDFNQQLKNKLNKKVETGVFGANMKVSLVNDGPVTILLEF